MVILKGGNEMYRKNAWEQYSGEERALLGAFADDYRAFLDAAKTEREAAASAEELCRSAGFRNLDALIESGEPLGPGDRVYRKWMNKSFMAFVIGEQSIEKGMNILGAHIDSPRLDVKQNPLFEDEKLAYLDTHYYGGIKKYQWLALPLALHGVIVKKDGDVVPVAIGEHEDDPVLCITDLLPHLAQEQMNKTASKFIDGEALNILIGSAPRADEEKDAVKAAVLAVLERDYGVEEEDFVSAELEAVPAGRARDCGLDRSMILGYGHDDRVCAYAEIAAMLTLPQVPEYTCCCLLADKEEIGSVGATGMRAQYFENAVAELLALTGKEGDLPLRRALAASRMLSCDVSAGYDPLYAAAFERKNAAFLGRGVCYNKFTGSRGKSGSNDANAEYLGRLRKIMDDHDISWQTAELGRVDLGGGGTIAYICALYGMEVVDSGVPVLSMHAPAEVISKADLYEAIRAYAAFLTDMGK